MKQDSAIFSERNLTALIVDDDEFQVDFAGDLLNDLGIAHILSATSGVKGLAEFDQAKKKPDILLCDIQMPDIDGFAFMKAMSERDFNGGVIFMSGQGAKVLYSASLVAQLSRQNFLGTIEKPLSRDALIDKIQKLT
jgi:CheY-like chemotaxis protein